MDLPSRKREWLARLALVPLIIVCAAPWVNSAQKKGTLASKPLTLTVQPLLPRGVINFYAPAPQIVETNAKCDANGDVYLVYSGAPWRTILPNLPYGKALLTLPVQELSLDSKTAISFPVPHVSDHQDVGRLDFNIDSQGKVYALLAASNPVGQGQTPKTDYYIAGYSGDGTNNSLVQISGIPDKNAIPLRLAAFLNGNFLLTGNTSLPGQEPKLFTAILASDGTFVTDIRLQSGGSLKSITGNGLAVSSPEGDVYVLRDTTPPRLAAISPQGQVVRELQVQPPLPHLQATQLGVAGDNYIFVQFSPVSTAQMSKENVGKMVEVWDLANGVPFAVYRLPLSKSDFGLAACATSPYQFFSLGTAPDDQLELIRYTPPGY